MAKISDQNKSVVGETKRLMALGKPKSKSAKSRRRNDLKHQVKMKNLVESQAIDRAIKRPDD